jgi:hypothetical protein
MDDELISCTPGKCVVSSAMIPAGLRDDPAVTYHLGESVG